MHLKVKKWGNSAAVRIPAATMTAAGLRLDDVVEVREEEGRVVIEPVREPVPNLSELLDRVSEENRHKEADFGGPVGNETW